MKKIALFICFLATLGLYAQQTGTVRGLIIDQEMNGEPMIFANIELQGTGTTVRSNYFGDFEIKDVQPGEHVLQVSFAGYKTATLRVEVKANEITEVQQGMFAEEISLKELAEVSENTKNANHIAVSVAKN